MFTWICPKCGTEVPPSYNDCPTCEAREKAASAPPAAPIVQAPVPVVQAPVVQAPVVQAPVLQAPVLQAPVLQAPVAFTQAPLMGTAPTESAPPMASYAYPPPPPGGGLPSWLIAVLSILGVAAIGYGVIHFMRSPNGASGESAAVTETARPSGDPSPPSPVAKFVEVVGFRIVESKQQVQLKFIIVNHSAGEIAPFDLELQVRAKSGKADEALFTVKTPVSGVLPYEAKDMTIPVKTSLRAYELPDWQFITATFQILQK